MPQVKLPYAQVHHPGLNETAMFHCGCWLSGEPGSDTNDKTLTRGSNRPALVPYRIRVQTSDVRGAGTDSDVFIVIHGSQGSSSEFELANAANNFERNQTDTFEVSGLDVGSIHSITVCCFLLCVPWFVMHAIVACHLRS
jgi:lipoxygenase homology domain-containing protein 1